MIQIPHNHSTRPKYGTTVDSNIPVKMITRACGKIIPDKLNNIGSRLIQALVILLDK